ncbi:MAG: amidohydrolase family protein [Bacteroidales bacterium]|nr:amidohydrolase family protein [Bacteroidales bacterium]
MKRFSAQYIITGTGTTLKRGIITTTGDGTITGITNTGGELRETGHTPFYNGIIIPGFINCHCHLELSSMKGAIPPSTDLPRFIQHVREERNQFTGTAARASLEADRDMYDAGINGCADICNSSSTFEIKENSKIDYISLLEIFGTNPEGANRRIAEIESLASEAAKWSTPWYITPHSLYSLSLPLLRKVKDLTRGNRVTSIHFMESPAEKEMMKSASGPLADSYIAMGITREMMEQRARNHTETVLSLVTPSGNLLLIHNTAAEENDIERAMQRDNIWWCLCPLSNRYIEDAAPPVEKLRQHGAAIVLGTDSLASNSTLSILEEMKEIAALHPSIPLSELVKWATANGAEALGMDKKLGTIEVGKRPGLLLLENIDLEKPHLTRDVTLRRLM